MVPPFNEIFDIEVKIRDLKDLNMLLCFDDSDHYFCVPNQFKNPEKYEITLEKYGDQLVQATMSSFHPSGHAFVVLDSIESCQFCI